MCYKHSFAFVKDDRFQFNNLLTFPAYRSSLLEIVALASTSKPSLKRKSSKLENDADFTPQSSDDETPRRTSKRLKKLEKTSIVPTLVNGKGKSKDVVDISSDVEVIDIDDRTFYSFFT